MERVGAGVFRRLDDGTDRKQIERVWSVGVRDDGADPEACAGE